MTKHQQIRFMAGNAVLAALVAILTLISNHLSIGPASFNLSLIPIVIGAIIYGPWSGLFLGLVNGGMVMLGAQGFFAMNVAGTILICLLKTGTAGLVAGFLYKLIRKSNWKVAVVVATISVPVINTSIFCVGALLFFQEAVGILFTWWLLGNFGIELAINVVLCPSILYIVKTVEAKYGIENNLEDAKDDITVSVNESK